MKERESSEERRGNRKRHQQTRHGQSINQSIRRHDYKGIKRPSVEMGVRHKIISQACRTSTCKVLHYPNRELLEHGK